MALIQCRKDKHTHYLDGDALSNLTVQWYLYVFVAYLWVPQSNAQVWVNDTNGTFSYKGFTNANGWLNFVVLTEYVANSTGAYFVAPYTITVNTSSYSIGHFARNPRTIVFDATSRESFGTISI